LCLRGMDGHGIQSFHGDLFSLVFSSNHFVSSDLSFRRVFLKDLSGFSG
jgi:hypothetical protein